MTTLPENIKFIGVDDDNLDLFEGQYPLINGISYNSYLIEDDKIAIIDTVDRRLTDEWLDNLTLALRGRMPDYLIVNHVEPDHSGSVRILLERFPSMKVVATAKALTLLGQFFENVDFKDRAVTVSDAGTLSLGSTSLRFLTAPMVHWPEVMVTLDETDGVLFSADAFGSFATSSQRDAWDNEARRYYCNIVGKYGPNVQSLLKKLASCNFSIIAPLHGPRLCDNLCHYIDLYDKWSRWEPETSGVLVAYASIYGGTARAARKLAALLRSHGESEVVLMDLSRHDVSFVLAEAFRLDRMALCSVTYDAGLFPAMYNFLHHAALKNLRNRKVALIENGSWAPVSGKIMLDMLAKMKDMSIVEPIVTLRGTLHEADTSAIDAMACNLMATR